jgi:hypothetical protein
VKKNNFSFSVFFYLLFIFKKKFFSFSVSYRKIPPPVATRWNSHCQMLEAIDQLERPLKRMRNIEGWEDLVPTDAQFDILLRKMLPILRHAKTLSEDLSADTQATAHRALIWLYGFGEALFDKLRNERHVDNDGPFAKFLHALTQEFLKRFPNYGANHRIFAYGHMLHPFWRGQLLQKLNLLDEYTNDMVEEHYSTTRYRSRVNKSNEAVSQSLLDDDLAGLDKTERALLADFPIEVEQAEPLKLEWTNFKGYARPLPQVHISI